MPWIIGGAMALGAGGSALGGMFGSSGAKKQARAMREAIAYQKQKDAETQARFVPYQELGRENVNAFQTWRDDPTKDPMAYLDPGYDFRSEQGEKAVTGNAATAGMLQSGDTLRALEGFGQDMASQEYNNAFNRWLQEGKFKGEMAGMGQSAAAQQGALANQSAGNVGNITSGAEFGAEDEVWGDVLAGMGGMAGNALARRFSPRAAPQVPGGSNIFAGGSSTQGNRLGLNSPEYNYNINPRYAP